MQMSSVCSILLVDGRRSKVAGWLPRLRPIFSPQSSTFNRKNQVGAQLGLLRDGGVKMLPRCIALCCLALLAPLQPASGQMPPQIVVQPQDEHVCAGSDAAFHVQAIGDPPLAFFWFQNFTPVTNGVISTPTSSSLTISNVASTDNGTIFFVVVTNQYGFQMSSNAFLHVPTPQITQITQDPFDQSVPLGATATFHVQASPAPLAYSWWFQGAQLSDSAHINGSTTDTLTIFNAQLGDAGYYRAEVTNTCLVVDSLPARCDVGNPPVITNQPVNVLAPFKASVQFRVGAFGPGLSYQWYRNDVPIPFANSPTLNLNGVLRPQVGIYHAVVFSALGAAASDRAHLQIQLTYEASILPRQEATDFPASLTNALRVFSPPPTVVFHGVPLLFSTYDATAETWETARCGVPPGHSMWLLYYSPRAETTKVSTEGSSFPTVAAVYTWDGNPNDYPTQIACDVSSGYNRRSLLSFAAQARTDYYIAVDGVGGASGTARLQVGDVIRNMAYTPANGTFHFEMAGPYWFNLTLFSTTNLGQPQGAWPILLFIPATNQDYVARYTNFFPRADVARFYNTAVNTNSSPP
jgi:hypothetical protein